MTDTVNVPREPTEAMIRSAVCEYLPPRQTPEDIAVAIYRAMLAAAPKAEPVKTDPQLAFENMRRHFPGDLREWTDLTDEQRKEWEEDVSERPHLYNLSRPETPKVEQLLCYECGSDVFIISSSIDRACAICNPDLNLAPASDELLEVVARQLAINNGHVTPDAPIWMNEPQDEQPAWKFYVDDARSVLTAIAQHKGPQS